MRTRPLISAPDRGEAGVDEHEVPEIRASETKAGPKWRVELAGCAPQQRQRQAKRRASATPC